MDLQPLRGLLTPSTLILDESTHHEHKSSPPVYAQHDGYGTALYSIYLGSIWIDVIFHVLLEAYLNNSFYGTGKDVGRVAVSLLSPQLLPRTEL